jgi:hypothetical protein
VSPASPSEKHRERREEGEVRLGDVEAHERRSVVEFEEVAGAAVQRQREVIVNN